MKSKTKYYIDESTIKSVFLKANLGQVTGITSLDAGEFNSAYFVTADEKQYVLKIAPKNNSAVLTYENNLMASEVAFYRIIEKNTTVQIPKVYFYDDSKTLLPSAYFIMEKLESKPLTECKLTKSERVLAYQELGTVVADLHKIQGESFGYLQNGLHSNWYLAIKSMVNNLVDDCKKLDKKLKGAEKLLAYIEKYKDILIKVESRYTHFDIWDGNIFYQKDATCESIAIIDTERGFWGDSIGDFVSIETFASLDKKMSISTYNKTADRPIAFTKEEIIRFNILKAYLGLIVHTEKFVRYRTTQVKYLINIVLAKLLTGGAFRALKKYDRNL